MHGRIECKLCMSELIGQVGLATSPADATCAFIIAHMFQLPAQCCTINFHWPNHALIIDHVQIKPNLNEFGCYEAKIDLTTKMHGRYINK